MENHISTNTEFPGLRMIIRTSCKKSSRSGSMSCKQAATQQSECAQTYHPRRRGGPAPRLGHSATRQLSLSRATLAGGPSHAPNVSIVEPRFGDTQRPGNYSRVRTILSSVMRSMEALRVQGRGPSASKDCPYSLSSPTAECPRTPSPLPRRLSTHCPWAARLS